MARMYVVIQMLSKFSLKFQIKIWSVSFQLIQASSINFFISIHRDNITDSRRHFRSSYSN